MLIDFDAYTVALDFPDVDEQKISSKLLLPFPTTLFTRSEVVRWAKQQEVGVEIAHEPFFNGEEKPSTVMKKIEEQRLRVDGEFYIDDFGFYVYYRVTTIPGLKDLRYD